MMIPKVSTFGLALLTLVVLAESCQRDRIRVILLKDYAAENGKRYIAVNQSEGGAGSIDLCCRPILGNLIPPPSAASSRKPVIVPNHPYPGQQQQQEEGPPTIDELLLAYPIPLSLPPPRHHQDGPPVIHVPRPRDIDGTSPSDPTKQMSAADAKEGANKAQPAAADNPPPPSVDNEPEDYVAGTDDSEMERDNSKDNEVSPLKTANRIEMAKNWQSVAIPESQDLDEEEVPSKIRPEVVMKMRKNRKIDKKKADKELILVDGQVQRVTLQPDEDDLMEIR